MENETKDDMLARHKRELKSLDGEKRSSLKKVKGTAGKGKKGKEAVAAAEAEFTTKEKEMKERHEKELESLSSDAEGTAAEVKEIESTTAAPAAAAEEGENDDEMQNLTPKERKQLKARRKKERQREKELQRQAEIEEELKKAGPSRRDTEIQIMNELYLSPKKLMIQEIPADGHCLYRAVAFQCGGENVDYTSMREFLHVFLPLFLLCCYIFLRRNV
uniref:OTU domain-containing protein n=1 Tax=Ditylum brightwellii TaxID=49249 RepID=A0A7S4UZK3_9STRA|mmetsp:Transcript_28907/g.38395  ORF Transcript_28907/g.38395 Transcript_28907/m.38395 type:complete len:218 (-) Transcript_28907:839-1492(-)